MAFKTVVLYLPEFYFFTCIMILLYYGSFFFSESYNFYRDSRIVLMFSLSTVSNLFYMIISSPFNHIFNLLFLFKLDYVILIELLFLFILFFILILSYKYNKYLNISFFEFSIFLLIGTLSLWLLLLSNNIMLFYLILELQGITFYVLTSLRKKSKYSIESGLKYFILGSFSSIIILFGITLFYGFTGVLYFSDFNILINHIFLIRDLNFIFILFLSVFFILVGLLFKLYCAPLHYWVPDIYQGAPTSTVFFFALLPPIVLLTMLIQLYVFYLLDFLFITKTFFFFGSLFSMVLGSLGGLVQRKLKKLLAFSSVLIIGNIFMLLTTINLSSIISLYFFFIIYLLNSLGFISIIINLSIIKNNFKQSFIENISFFSGLANTNKVIGFFLTVILFSFAGIPPSAGFLSKLFMYADLLSSFDFFLLIISISTSVVSVFYYIRLLKIVYYDKNDNFKLSILSSIEYSSCFSIFIFVFLNFFFFINPYLILNTITISILDNSLNTILL